MVTRHREPWTVETRGEKKETHKLVVEWVLGACTVDLDLDPDLESRTRIAPFYHANVQCTWLYNTRLSCISVYIATAETKGY